MYAFVYSRTEIYGSVQQLFYSGRILHARMHLKLRTIINHCVSERSRLRYKELSAVNPYHDDLDPGVHHFLEIRVKCSIFIVFDSAQMLIFVIQIQPQA